MCFRFPWCRMTGIRYRRQVVKILAVAVLVAAGALYGTVWILQPEASPALLQGISATRDPSQFANVGAALTGQLRRHFAAGTARTFAASTLEAQGFRRFGAAGAELQQYFFLRQDFPCEERFTVKLLFDEADAMRDVQGDYWSSCS